MNKETVEKYFNNQTTTEQTARVLKWFETHEGQQYLHERLDVDNELMDRSELAELVPELDSEMLYGSIREKINHKEFSKFRNTDWVSYAVKAAAVIFVVLTASLFHLTNQQFKAENLAELEREPVSYTTKGDQHREIWLGDGSRIRLNINSEVIVSKDYMQKTREIILYGEAYFDVVHNPDQPFIIHTNQSTVEVLGTSFNLRSHKEDGNVQVAVIDGKVSLKSKENNPQIEQLSIILSKNQYAYLDLEGRTIVVDDLAVSNYLAWKNGRFDFNDLTLKQVCNQLTRIYYIDCHFEQPEISELSLTASFYKGAIEKALSVIALTLDIDFELYEDQVSWSNEGRKVEQKIGD